MTNSQRREIERHLEDQLTRLRHQARSGNEETGYCADDNEFASRLTEMRMNVTLQSRINTQIKEIEAALRRIDVADYGFCEECGDQIPVARLKAKPTTTLCVHCQSEQESAPMGMAATYAAHYATGN